MFLSLNSFGPFQSDVWGTVSDWVMILVTIVTAYFLYKTLQSQKDVQGTQNKLLQIEQIRLKTDVKPFLRYSQFEDVYSSELGNTCIAIAVMNTSPNIAISAEPLFTNMPKMSLTLVDSVPMDLTNEGGYLRLYFVFKDISKIDFSFDISFNDVALIRYSQHVFCAIDNESVRIIASVPDEIL